MAYDALRKQLADGPDVTFAAFPDGSVDTRYTVRHGEAVIASREAFGESVASGAFDSFRLEGREMSPGGQAPNAAAQADALGADARLAGHLDAEPLSRFGFPTYSMGNPASVTILGFDDGDAMFAEESRDIAAWTFEDLLAAVPPTFSTRTPPSGSTGSPFRG